MYGKDIIQEYKHFESFDRRYTNFERYIVPHLTADLQKALQEMISVFNSTILKWERFNEHLNTHKISVNTTVLSNAEKAIYTAVENRKKVDILIEIEKAYEEYRQGLIQKSKQRVAK